MAGRSPSPNSYLPFWQHFSRMTGPLYGRATRSSAKVADRICPKVPDETPILTLRQAAAFLALHPNTVRSLVRAGQLPGSKTGRKWRFIATDLVAWIRTRYPERARVQLSADDKEATWHSIDVQAHIMSNSQHQTERQLDILLERPTGKRPRNITTS
ncbi:MAG: hypothetical protein DI540_22575 [Sphingobium sp.]|nr:MAG: hypothetical protein DI540_22575 [Sphingobium sp.]